MCHGIGQNQGSSLLTSTTVFKILRLQQAYRRKWRCLFIRNWLCSYTGRNLVTYASLALTQAEQPYSQIEKELLAQVPAAVFNLEPDHQYIYGRRIILYTDHKPLVRSQESR